MVTESESSTDVICDLALPWKKNFLKEMIKWKHLQKEPGGAGAKWMDWWEGTRSPLSRNTEGGEMGLSGGESRLRPNNH